MRMSCEEFAINIVESGDLDPDYIFLLNVFNKLKLTDEQRATWIVMKTVVYNSCSEAEIFFRERTFENVEYGAERRKHKRYAKRYFEAFKAHAVGRAASVHRYFRGLPPSASVSLQALRRIDGVGPWAAWKCLDLLERVLHLPVDFSSVDFRIAYEYPLKGILMLAGHEEDVTLLKDSSLYRDCLEISVNKIGAGRLCLSPPTRDRPIGVQEFETIFCKYHSYMHGHYTPGEDLHRLRRRVKASPFESVRSLEDCLP